MNGKDIEKVFDYINETCTLADELGVCMTNKCPFVNDGCMGDECALCLMKGEHFWDKFTAFREVLDYKKEIFDERQEEIDEAGYYDNDYEEYMNSMRDADADARWEMEQGVF